MGLFVSSRSLARRHGAYAMEARAPATMRASGTGVVALVGTFPWGPDDQIVEPTSMKDFINTMAPPGMSHLASGYLAVIKKAFPTLRIVRATGSSKAKSTCAIPASSTKITLTAKCYGAAGDSIVAVVSNASDGDSNHFNLTVSVTGASGQTIDTFQNLNYSGTGTDSSPSFTNTLLVGAITKNASGRPANDTYTFSGGLDGTIDSTAYVGTAQTGDKGIARLETDRTIRHVVVDYSGSDSPTRVAINQGLVAHATLMGDRICYLSGPSGQTVTQVKADPVTNSYGNANCVYVDGWAYILDDIDGTERLVPSAPFLASVAAQLSPSTSIAWKSPEVQAMLSGIHRLETDRGAAIADITDCGIVCLINEDTGGFTFESDVTTSYPTDPSTSNLIRARMGIYIADSFVRSTRSFVDAPSVKGNHQMILAMTDRFMAGLKRAAEGSDPEHTPHVLDYGFDDFASVNSLDDLANGDVTIPLKWRDSVGIHRLFLQILHGQGVVISPAR